MATSDADPGQEPGLLILVGRALGIAALVIAASAGLFLGIGAFGAGDDAPTPDDGMAAPDGDDGSGEVSDEDPGGADDGTAGDDPVDETDGDDPDAPAEDPGDGTDGDTAAEPDPDEAEPDPDAADAADGDGSGEVSDEAERDEGDASSAVPPEGISVQVLDGGGDAAADAVAAELSEAGYRIIAQNPALPYEVTTVLWTAGFEAEGRQVAAEIGAAEVREQPGNLSENVMVHVVVGADRG